MRASLLLTTAIAAVAFIACPPGTVRVEVRDARDDGSVSTLTAFPPGQAGFIISRMEEVRAGVGVSGGGDTLAARPLYRFDVTDWTGGEVTLHLKTVLAAGTPGPIECYCVPDFDRLPDTTGIGPLEVSSYWFLPDSGCRLAERTPTTGTWFTVSVPESIVTSFRSAGNTLAFCLRLKDETLTPENWYRFTTFDYAKARGEDVPYLDW